MLKRNYKEFHLKMKNEKVYVRCSVLVQYFLAQTVFQYEQICVSNFTKMSYYGAVHFLAQKMLNLFKK